MGAIFTRLTKGSAAPGVLEVGAICTTTTSGTLSTATGAQFTYGCTIVKTATKTGRYTITVGRPVTRLWSCAVTIVGPDDAALTTTKGLNWVLRDDDLASDGTIELQFVQTNAGNADTELQDGAKFTVVLNLIDSGAR